MKLPLARLLIAVGIASATLVSLSTVLGETKFDWVGLPFWVPGFFAAAAMFPQGIEGDRPIAYLALVCILNFVFTGFAVLFLVKCFNNFSRKKRQG